MTNNLVSSLSKLQKILENPFENETLYKAAQNTIVSNPWFDLESINYSLKSVSSWLNTPVLQNFLKNYKPQNQAKKIAVICAGNIPIVGFHDMLCVLLSGNVFLGKTSSGDKYLLPAIGEILSEIDKEFKDKVFFTETKIENFDAVIATGSNNSNMYFEYYFGKHPNLIRHSRTSIGVLNGKEKSLDLIASDMLTHKGLGCRNISKVFIPNNYDFTPLMISLEKYSHLLDHNKYRNNYDYYKSIYIMNNISYIDTGNCILLENKELFSPVSVVYYTYYNDISKVNEYIKENQTHIQCIASEIIEIQDSIPLGEAQTPKINDFPDNIDTMEFLCNL